MPGAYTYPPDQKLLREKLSCLPKTDTQEAWENFERFWQDRKPVEQKVTWHFAFVGIPYALLLRGFFALCLIGLSLLFYNTVNAKLPAVIASPKAGALHHQADALKPAAPRQNQTLRENKSLGSKIKATKPKALSSGSKGPKQRSKAGREDLLPLNWPANK